MGPKGEGKLEDEPVYIFTESSDMVVRIQCLKIYHKKSGWLFAKQGMKSEYATSGAAFYGKDGRAPEKKLINFISVNLEDYNNPRLDSCIDGAEVWMVPKESKAQVP